MSKAYYRDAAGVLLVYDICNKNSFEKMKTTWLTQIRNFADENIRIILGIT
jgi:GTPase SAR1 family protein